MNPTQFYNKVIGKSIDFDRVAGYQCVDLWKYFSNLMNNWYTSCGGDGYAYNLYTRRTQNGILKYFKDMGSNPNVLQDGDWVVWNKGSKVAPYSHLAMYYQGKFLGQNQNGSPKVNLISISYEGIIGILRPIQYVNSNQNTISTNIKYVYNCDYLNERIGPGTNYEVVNALKVKTAVRVYEIVNNFARIEKNMWVANNYLTSKAPDNHLKSMEVYNCDYLNVRNAPNKDIVDKIPVNTVVSVLKEENNWVKIGDNKWVYKTYLK